jgi:hypothetical protein
MPPTTPQPRPTATAGKPSDPNPDLKTGNPENPDKQTDAGGNVVAPDLQKTGNPALAGRLGFDRLTHSTPTPKDLFGAAQKMAPALTREFVDTFELTDEHLAGIASGDIPPPPVVGPAHTVDLYYQPGGWTSVPVGVDPRETPGSH